MDWKTALPNLSYTLLVTTRQGRVLLASGPVPGIVIGRSMLKMVDQEDVITVGRAAKRALEDGEVRVVGGIVGSDGSRINMEILPFSREGNTLDHLLVTVTRAAVLRTSTPEPSGRANWAPKALHSEKESSDNEETEVPPATRPAISAFMAESPQLPESGEVTFEMPFKAPTTAPTSVESTPNTHVDRHSAPMQQAPKAQEVLVVVDSEHIAIGHALARLLDDVLPSRAIPLGRFGHILHRRSGATTAESIPSVISPETRVIFCGPSEFSIHIQDTSARYERDDLTQWYISGGLPRMATILPTKVSASERLAILGDLQFETGEYVRRGLAALDPIRRAEMPDGLRLAAALFDDPIAFNAPSGRDEELFHNQMILGLARFLEQGLPALLDGA